MKVFQKAYLHVGSAKTGSTSIQNFLARNRSALLRDGYCYPKAFGLSNHIGLTLYARSTAVLDELPRLLGATTSADIERLNRAAVAQFAEEAAAISGGTTILLLSNEHLHNRIQSIAEIQRLHDLLDPYCEQICIIMYLRRQDRLATSMASTRVKAGGSNSKASIFPQQEKLRGIYFDYDKIVSRFEHVFGRENSIVRIFQPDALVNADVVEDYCAAVGLRRNQYGPSPSDNKSISRFGQVLLSEMNATMPLLIDNKPNPARRGLGEAMQQLFPKKGEFVARAEAMAFVDGFDESNRALCDRYFLEKNGHLFDADFSMYPEQAEVSDYSFADACAAAARLWAYQSSRLQELRQELLETRKKMTTLEKALPKGPLSE